MSDPNPAPEPAEGPLTDAAREYFWNPAAAIILSLATLTSAWCGFQASTWGSVGATESRTASTLRMEASRQAAVADRQMSNDVLLFTAWVEADITGQEQFATELAQRFQPHFKPAFEAWLAGPVTQGHLPAGSPFEQDAYALPTQAQADEATRLAVEAIDRADEAIAISGHYVLATVLFASVLFLSGIASKLSQPRLAHVVVVLAGLTLLGAVVTMAMLPVSL